MTKQPYYHSASVLFTATLQIDRDEFTRLLREAFARVLKRNRSGIIVDSLECEQIDDEPGDPADLL